jgi:hypothetical protein
MDVSFRRWPYQPRTNIEIGTANGGTSSGTRVTYKPVEEKKSKEFRVTR